MSTFLQTLAVVVISIAAATAVTVKDPDQPATLRESRRRDDGDRHGSRTLGVRRREVREQERRERAARPPRPPRLVPRPDATPMRAPMSTEMGGFSDHWVPAPVGPTIWLRVRSGLMLTILLTMIGTLVAVTIGGVVVFIAFALRSAVS